MISYEKTPYTNRQGAIKWLIAHVEKLEDIADNEFGATESDKICRLRAENIMESLLGEPT